MISPLEVTVSTLRFRVVFIICLFVLTRGFQPEIYNSTEPIKTVEVSNSGDVIVITANSILQFHNLSISYEDLEHDIKTTTNNHADKISFFKQVKFEGSDIMIQCNSAECFIHDMTDITNFTKVAGKTNVFPLMPTLGAQGSAGAVFKSCQDNFCKIFSAQTTSDGTTYITDRYFTNHQGVYRFSSTHGPYGIIKSAVNQNFDFVHSFLGGDYAYFLRNVRMDTGETLAYVSQICVNDDNFRSYIESKIDCGGYSHFLASTTAQTTNGMVMFASFGLKPFLDDITDTSESVICTYKLSELEEKFSSILTDCFKHTKGSWPQWIGGAQDSCSTYIKNKRYKCGYTDLNTRIDSNITLHMNYISPKYHYENVVSIVMRQQGAHTLGYFGTQEGEIVKVLYNTSTNTIQRIFKLKVSNAPVRHVTLSEDESQLFYLSANTVGKVPLNTCDIRQDCYSCIMADLPCVWMTDMIGDKKGRCVAESVMGHHVQNHYEKSCLPVVYSIEPKSGPIGGGTVVTISGQLDTPTWYGAIYANDQVERVPVTVRIGNAKCQVVDVSQFPKQLECVTSKQLKPTNTTLRFQIQNGDNGAHTSYRLVRSRGLAVFKPKFSYLEPKLYDSAESPTQKVRLSGGTQITIYGSNLDTGNHHTKRITIGDKDCPITNHDSILPGLVTCRSPAQRIPASYDISYSIDNNMIAGRSSVLYISDPINVDIQPRSSIFSGGVHLTISGEHLEGLGRDSVILRIDILEQDEDMTVESDCTYQNETSTFLCSTYPSPIQEPFPLHGRANLYNVYGELVPLNLSMYIVPDPTVDKEDKLIDGAKLANDTRLSYNGSGLENISIADVKIFVGATPCHVMEIFDAGIECIVRDISDVGLGIREKVKCRIGLRTYDLGTLAFKEAEIGLSRARPTETPTMDLTGTLKIFGGIILGAMLLFTVGIGIKRKYQTARARKNERYSVSYHGERRILNLQGLTENLTTDAQQNRANDYVENRLQRTDAEASSSKETDPLLLDEETRDLFEGKHLLIPSELLVIGETVGQGNFGCVYKGYLKQPEEKTERIVACKTLQRNKPKEMDVKTFLKEALIMKDFHHTNVMELVGICLGIEKLPLVVLPFMRMGDVLTYIRNVDNVPTVKDLVVFGVDIANGMYYLSQLKFVHRDLAARNCMIDEDMTVKVADFGLSRDVYEKEYYSSNDKKAQLPVKWMSPESLEFGLFTTKSDVWSFGVVLWELLTRGVNPYPTVDNWDILRYLKDNRRLSKPDFCPEEMYRIMQSCWEWNPDDRPQFGDLTISIPDLLRRLERASERRKHLASLSEERERNEQL